MDRRTLIFALWGLALALALAFLLAPLASSQPDGLEKVAHDSGFAEREADPWWTRSPLPDYRLPGVENEFLATGLAGLAGTLLVFMVGWGLARAVSAGKGWRSDRS